MVVREALVLISQKCRQGSRFKSIAGLGLKVEVCQFPELDLPRANSFGYFEACKSGANSFSPEPIPLESGTPVPNSTLFGQPK